jgi:uncharacterized membrane protein YgcG
MTRRRLLSRLDLPRLEEAIRRAEQASAVELRISIAGLHWGDPERVADKAFQRLGMAATARRNAVLLLVSPWRRRVVVRADQGITSQVDGGFWTDIVDAVTAAFKAGRYTEGLAAAVDALAQRLAPLFPPVPGDVNELPDAIDRGRVRGRSE